MSLQLEIDISLTKHAEFWLDNPKYRIMAGTALGGILGATHAAYNKHYPYITDPEKAQTTLASIIKGMMLGGGVSAISTVAIPKLRGGN